MKVHHIQNSFNVLKKLNFETFDHDTFLQNLYDSKKTINPKKSRYVSMKTCTSY